ncbi:MAG: M36 family metallopeptidase [Saprospiraceae bacterium]|nr:M36 family metallopeptidase [Saprospiraceae bacterium]
MTNPYCSQRPALLTFLFLLLLTALTAQEPVRNAREIALRYLQGSPAQFELSAEDVSDVKVIREYTTKHNGVTHVWVQQQLAGIPVRNGLFGLHVTPNGKVAHLGHDFITGLRGKANTTMPSLGAAQAVQMAAAQIGFANVQTPVVAQKINDRNWVFEAGDFSKKPVPVSICYHIEKNGNARLAWDVQIDQRNTSDLWSLVVDAQTGRILKQQNHTQYCKAGHPHRIDSDNQDCKEFAKSAAKTQYTPASPQVLVDETYNIFPIPAESPAHGDRTLVTNPYDPTYSPYGWHDTNGQAGAEYTYTRGNNAWAFNDATSDDTPTAAESANGGVNLLFDFPYDPNAEPAGNADAAITNLFYMNNMMHDIGARFGFDAEAGNFQANNYGQGGSGGDEVYAQALDGSGTDNANFSTPQDGSNGRMQMYKWNRQGGRPVTVNAPNVVIGPYAAATTSWGYQIDDNLITGDVVVMDDGSNDPTWGCQGPQNDVNGKIAMIDRGGCEFGLKALKAEQGGAIGCVICNFDDATIAMGAGAVGAQVTIPVVMMTVSQCALLRQYAGAGGLNMSFGIAAGTGGPDQLDGDFDNGIISHEYGHGISNRLTGNGFSCLGNAEQMGEGWSDFMSLITSVEPGDVGNQKQGIGTYVLRQDNDGTGIRRYPYSTDMSISPVTYATVAANPEVHATGEVWTAMLWDLYWAMVEKYGYDANLTNPNSGNARAIQLVMDGMKMQPCNPGFVSGRDAILLADEINYNNADTCLIYSVFARRGLGVNADQGSEDSATDGTENFDPIPTCVKELKISKTTDTPTIEPEGTASFTIKITNHKDETAAGVVVTENVSFGLTPTSISNNGTYANGVITWNLGDMPSGQVKQVTYSAKSGSGFGSTRLFRDELETEDEWYSGGSVGTELFYLQTDVVKTGSSAWKANAVDVESDFTLETTRTLQVSGNQPILRFWHQFNTQKGIDAGFVEIQDLTLPNPKFVRIPKDRLIRNGYTSAVDYQTFTIPFLSGFSGSSNGWQQSYIDLSDYAGKNITFRFRFGTSAAGTVNDAGWIVDDVEMLDLLNYESEACVTDASGDQACATTPEHGVFVNPLTVGTNDLLATSGIEMLAVPNPANELLHVSLSQSVNGPVRAVLYSTDGRLAAERSSNGLTTGNVITLNVANLPSGVYMLRLESEKGSAVSRVVVK